MEGVPRYHISYGVTKKVDAEPLHTTAVALFRAGELPVIEAMRAGRVSIEQLTQLRLKGLPYSQSLARVTTIEPWPYLPDAIDDYIAALAANPTKSERTAAMAREQLNRFLAWAKPYAGAAWPMRLDEVTSRMVNDYQAHLVAAKFAVNTITPAVTRVGSVFNWHRRREEREAREAKRPARALHTPLDPETISRAQTHSERFLSPVEAEHLLAATPKRLLFHIAAGLFAGFRINETCHLRTEYDVDLELGVLSVQRQPTWRPKTKRSVRHVPIAGVLRPILEHHLAHRSSAEWLVPAFSDPTRPLSAAVLQDHFRRIVVDAELGAPRRSPDRVTYHTLRHTFASWLLMRGTDVYTVAKLLGNSMKQVEETYGHLAKDFRQTAVDRLSSAITLPSLDEAGDSDPGRAGGENSATRNATTEGEECPVS